METIGYIALAFFSLIGFVMTALAVGEYVGTQFRLFGSKVSKEIEVRKENINAAGEAKKERLAKKRAVQNAIADRKLEKKLGKMKAKANEELGEEYFKIEEPAPYVEPSEPARAGSETASAPEVTAVVSPHTSKPVIKASAKTVETPSAEA